MPADGIVRSQWSVGRYMVTMMEVTADEDAELTLVPRWQPARPEHLTAGEWQEYFIGMAASMIFKGERTCRHQRRPAACRSTPRARTGSEIGVRLSKSALPSVHWLF